MRIKKGDNVKIIAGKNKGLMGIVKETLPKKNLVIVESINMVKVHVKPKQNQEKGEIKEKEAPIHISNVQLVDTKSKIKTTTKIGYRISPKTNKKVRFAKKSGLELK